jgi:TNF receptor-associated protein 1
VKALWTLPKGSINEEQHKEFYQFIAKAYDEPRFSFHYSTDSPIQIQSLFYVPEQHTEKYGMGRMEPGVSLYCRRVLIQSKCKGLLPDWLRFLKGVVDSEDIPLNLSREHLQDSALISRLSSVLTRRILKFLYDESKNEESNYDGFIAEYGNFLKEGIITDFTYKEDIAKLLRFESSREEPGKMISFDDYVDRMPLTQNSIYYLCTPSRSFAETSPYYEAFQRKGIEVIFFYSSLDEVVLGNLQNFRGKKLESIESATDLPEDKQEQEEAKSKDETVVRDFSKWVKDSLEDKVSVVRESSRITKTPAIVVDHDSAPMRRIMTKIDPVNAPKLPRQVFEYNINHPIMKKINLIRFSNETFAKTILEQVFDNALIAAGLLDDPRVMLGRLNTVLEKALESEESTKKAIE